MSIAPITGKLRKAFWRDVIVSLGLGIGSGYAFWYGHQLPAVQRREEYYLKLERERAQGQAV